MKIKLNQIDKAVRELKDMEKTITLKDVPCDLWDKLKANAKKEGKIFNRYVIQILQESIESNEHLKKGY